MQNQIYQNMFVAITLLLLVPFSLARADGTPVAKETKSSSSTNSTSYADKINEIMQPKDFQQQYLQMQNQVSLENALINIQRQKLHNEQVLKFNENQLNNSIEMAPASGGTYENNYSNSYTAEESPPKLEVFRTIGEGAVAGYDLATDPAGELVKTAIIEGLGALDDAVHARAQREWELKKSLGEDYAPSNFPKY